MMEMIWAKDGDPRYFSSRCGSSLWPLPSPYLTGRFFNAILPTSMVQIVREFVVREEARGPFELAFGPGGLWSRLFARSIGFQGITLLRDTKNPRRYLMVESWGTEAQREQALAEQQEEYAQLEAALAKWTESRAEWGVFRMLAQAAVRPLR